MWQVCNCGVCNSDISEGTKIEMFSILACRTVAVYTDTLHSLKDHLWNCLQMNSCSALQNFFSTLCVYVCECVCGFVCAYLLVCIGSCFFVGLCVYLVWDNLLFCTHCHYCCKRNFTTLSISFDENGWPCVIPAKSSG